jgi:hypothetical protein
MATHRVVVDGSLFLPKEPCDTAAAVGEQELLEIAVRYAVDAHGHWDTPALREELRSMLRAQGVMD